AAAATAADALDVLVVAASDAGGSAEGAVPPRRKRLPQAHFATWPAAVAAILYCLPQPGHAITGIRPSPLCRFSFRLCLRLSLRCFAGRQPASVARRL